MAKPEKARLSAKSWVVLATVCMFATALYAYLQDEDYITFSPTPNEKAVLIDGVKDGVFWNDWSPGVVSAATNPVKIGKFTTTSSPNSGEVVAFSPGKAPFIKAPSPWGYFTDTVNVEFHDTYNIEVKVWLLTDNAYNNQSQVVEPNCAKARSIWEQEGHGLRITCDIQDARDTMLTHVGRTGEAKTLFDSNHAFDCDDLDDSNLLSSTAYSAGVLNVYYVDQVSTVIGSGQRYAVHCNGTPTVIAIGAASVIGLLAHEIGHALIGNGVEDHIDELSPWLQCQSMPNFPCTASLPPTAGTGGNPSLFDRTNVMHGASSWRTTLTEGQVFRAFFNKSSVLNHASIYNLGMGNRDTCGGVGGGTGVPPVHTNECPQLEKRLWPDDGGEYGPWPAN